MGLRLSWQFLAGHGRRSVGVLHNGLRGSPVWKPREDGEQPGPGPVS